MILTCEKCHTRYLLPAGMLGDGRTVRCTSCSHEWFQVPKEESFADVFEQVKPQQDSVNNITHDEEFILLAEDVIPQETEKSAKWAPGMTTGVVAAVFLAVILLTAILMFRGPVLKIWPDGLAFYNALGLIDPVPGEGLVFENLQATTSYNKEGEEILRITGEVKNILNHAVMVPGLRFSLRDEQGKEIQTWSYPSPKADIPAQKSIPLTATYPKIAADVKELNVRFISE